MDDVWFATNCLFQHDGLIYSFRDEIIELNPYTWYGIHPKCLGDLDLTLTKLLGGKSLPISKFPTRSLTPLGIVPAPLDQRGRCVPLEIDGEIGVFISVGNWFSLRSLTWRKLASPPLDPIALFPNALFGLGGRPTLFGAPVKELKTTD